MTPTNPVPSGQKPSRLKAAGKILDVATGIGYLNPKKLAASSGYTRGSVLAASWSNLRQAWSIKRSADCRHESFEDAKYRLNLTDEVLSSQYDSICLSSRYCYITAVLIFIFSIVYLVHGDISSFFCAFFFSFISAYCALLRAFRAWQIEIRKLSSFTLFLRTPHRWVI